MEKSRNLNKAQRSRVLKTLNSSGIYVDFSNKSKKLSIYDYICRTTNCKSIDVISNTSCISNEVINNACFDIYKIVRISESGYTQDQEKKTNQDNYFGIVSDDKERYFIGVCDGHGQKGHVVSKYVVDYIEDNSSILFFLYSIIPANSRYLSHFSLITLLGNFFIFSP